MDYWHPIAVEERARDARIEKLVVALLAKPKRQPARHRFHPVDLRCIDCNVTVLENANVPYGYGVPCNSPAVSSPVTEKDRGAERT